MSRAGGRIRPVGQDGKLHCRCRACGRRGLPLGDRPVEEFTICSRNQTQNRLERELTGHQSGGLSEAAPGREWVALTTPLQDFQQPDVRILQSPAPFLAVVKKNVVVLAKLDRWLEAADRYLADMPILVIDDEADQASINTKGNRAPDPAVTDDEDYDEDIAPSRTNALIRSILARAPKTAYIAYTATPFANILVQSCSR